MICETSLLGKYLFIIHYLISIFYEFILLYFDVLCTVSREPSLQDFKTVMFFTIIIIINVNHMHIL